MVGVVGRGLRGVGGVGGLAGRGGYAAQLAHGGAGGRRLLEVHQRRARRAVHAHRRRRAAPRDRAQHLRPYPSPVTHATHLPQEGSRLSTEYNSGRKDERFSASDTFRSID